MKLIQFLAKSVAMWDHIQKWLLPDMWWDSYSKKQAEDSQYENQKKVIKLRMDLFLSSLISILWLVSSETCCTVKC